MTRARAEIHWSSNFGQVAAEHEREFKNINETIRHAEKFYETMEKSKLENAKKYAKFREEFEKRNLKNRHNRLKHYIRREKELYRDELRAYKENETRKTREHREQVKRRMYRMRLARRERIAAEREEARVTERLQREVTRSYEREARRRRQIMRTTMSNVGAGSNALFAGASRLGGFLPNTVVGAASRSAVTGGFLGYGLAAPVGRAVSGFSKLGGPIAGGIGSVAGLGISALGGLKGAQIGVTLSLAGQAFAMGSRMFTRAVSSFTRIVTSMVSRLSRLAVIGTVGAVAGGVAASASRQRAIQGLATVAGGDTASLVDLVNQTASSKGGSLFGRTALLQNVMGGAAFGFNPSQIRKLLPTAINTSALSGEPVQDSLRAFARAAFQGETERAEAFLLNLRENKLTEMFGGKYNLKTPSGKSEAVIQAILQQGERFAGGAAKIGGTLPGALSRFTSRGADVFASLGRGFEVGSDFTNRLNDISGKLGSLTGGGVFSGIGSGLGGIAGRALGFIQNNMPNAQSFSDFFSSNDEGTRASRWGDALKNALQKAVDLVSTIRDLMTGEDGVFSRMKKQWEDLRKNLFNEQWWQNKINKLADIIAIALDRISGQLGETFSNIATEAVKGTGRKAIHLVSDQGVIGGLKYGTQFFANALNNATMGGVDQFGSMMRQMGVPGFAMGTGVGTVPGPKGKPQLSVVHGGEQIINPAQMAGRYSSTSTSGWIAQKVGDVVNKELVPPIVDLGRKIKWASEGMGRNDILGALKSGSISSMFNVASGANKPRLKKSGFSVADWFASFMPKSMNDTGDFGSESSRSYASPGTAAVQEEEKKAEKAIQRINAFSGNGYGGGGGGFSGALAGLMNTATLRGGNSSMVYRMALASANGYGGKAFNPYSGEVYQPGQFDGTAIQTPATWGNFNLSRGISRGFSRGGNAKADWRMFRRGNAAGNVSENLGPSVYDYAPSSLGLMPQEQRLHFGGGGTSSGNGTLGMMDLGIGAPTTNVRQPANGRKTSGINYNFYGNVYNNGGPDSGVLAAQTVGI